MPPQRPPQTQRSLTAWYQPASSSVHTTPAPKPASSNTPEPSKNTSTVPKPVASPTDSAGSLSLPASSPADTAETIAPLVKEFHECVAFVVVCNQGATRQSATR
ncbi:unnamed protein product [Parajaminaea phylloscopi]